MKFTNTLLFNTTKTQSAQKFHKEFDKKEMKFTNTLLFNTTKTQSAQKFHKEFDKKEMKFTKLTDREEYLASQIVDIAITIHKQLGPGLLESVYEKIYCFELGRRQILYQRQMEVPIFYQGFSIDGGLRLDLLVENLIIVELKAQENFHPVWEAQLLSYLKLSGKRLGFILNFHVPLMRDGIKRMIL